MSGFSQLTLSLIEILRQHIETAYTPEDRLAHIRVQAH